jgi:hypothetical protein
LRDVSRAVISTTFAAGKAVISCRDRKQTTLTGLFSCYQRGRSLVVDNESNDDDDDDDESRGVPGIGECACAN